MADELYREIEVTALVENFTPPDWLSWPGPPPEIEVSRPVLVVRYYEPGGEGLAYRLTPDTIKDTFATWKGNP